MVENTIKINKIVHKLENKRGRAKEELQKNSRAENIRAFK
jgi:hypothetical protein